MTEVVASDASSLIVLEKLHRLDLIEQLFDKVLIPDVVIAEIRRGSDNREEAFDAYKCFQITSVAPSNRLNHLLLLLDAGEANAIELAASHGLPLIIDECKGCDIAQQMGLKITGFNSNRCEKNMNKRPILGVIADDFTGATDIAAMLVRGGMQVVQTIGIPSTDLLANIEADAIVVALKSRSIPAQDAIEQSLAAWQALASIGVQQCYFKYCSTFDSTPEGNIGPVTEALAKALNVKTVAHIPALPVNGRSVYQGHLFVFDKLLNESGMEKHPLNPMSDANLVRWLEQQSKGDVALIAQAEVAQGTAALRARMSKLEQAGVGQVIGDAVSEQDLTHWGAALVNAPLVAGGSGLATPLAREHAALGHYRVEQQGALAAQAGTRPALMLAGSCSQATLKQIERFTADGGLARRLDPREIAVNPECVAQTIAWAQQNLSAKSVLVYASGTTEQVQAAQAELGVARAGQLAEEALSRIARELMKAGGTEDDGRLIAAGGETSGAVVSQLGVVALRIGPEIDPGVPWTQALDSSGQVLGWLALKSGNFGAEDFFAKAVQILDDAGDE